MKVGALEGGHSIHVGSYFLVGAFLGTGLGLMVSKKIIENHKGSVAIASEENKGYYN